MDVEISTIKIKKEKQEIELTLDEAKDLYWKLNEYFGVNTASTTSFPSIAINPAIQPPFDITCSDDTSQS